MHVLFVSQCEKKALKRTRAILDRYAIRIADRCWVTPITEEALHDVRLVIRRQASRHTAVACYRNKGMQQMRLLWTVGKSSTFGAQGEAAIGTRSRAKPQLPPWAKIACLVAQAGGFDHDVGKASRHFQHKLHQALTENSVIIKDRTRHEWTSMKLYQWMRRLKLFDWSIAWQSLKDDPAKNDMPFKVGTTFKPISSVFDALDFIVLTHHSLLGPSEPKNSGDTPTNEEHTQRLNGMGDDDSLFEPAADIDMALLGRLARLTERLQQAHIDRQDDPSYWRAIAIISRAGLILADHEVSSRTPAPNLRKKSSLFANTKSLNFQSFRRSRSSKKQRACELNQSLEWHLSNVGMRAAEYVHYFVNSGLPGVTQQSRDQILSPSCSERFSWQDVAVSHLCNLSENFIPTLIFNLAGTGAGKTRMNVKALTALRPEEEPLRIAAGFNLRTLTLQTHSALKSQLGLGEDEVACVIGDRLPEALHDAGMKYDEDNELELEYETTGGVAENPAWLRTLLLNRPHLSDLVGSPVLVSTMDYLVNAGDLSKQGHHAEALLRIASSDLILDEVDSYDPESLVSVLRVVQMSALFGRNIIASSATLAEPVANALFEAYQSGVEMYAALRNATPEVRVAFLDNHLDPHSVILKDKCAFNDAYRDRLQAQMRRVSEQPIYRMPTFRKIPLPNSPSPAFDTFCHAIEESVFEMHKNHRWNYIAGKRVSFGIVRVAQVKTCVEIARRLGKHPCIHVTAYHSVDMPLRKFRKEQALDRLFKRNPEQTYGSNSALLSDPDIQDRVAKTPGDDILFIVVATPIEEVGRDHDFDWAVIEPSSVHSIVQLAGRVNRHRLISVTTPNITILQYNLRYLEKKARSFFHPGNEPADFPYETHDVCILLGEELERLDATLQFGVEGEKCKFAKYDENSVKTRLDNPIKVIRADASRPLTWITIGHYKRYPLRQRSAAFIYRISLQEESPDPLLHEKRKTLKDEWVTTTKKIESSQPANPYWLIQDLEEVIEEADTIENESYRASALTFERSNKELTLFDRFLGGY
ncbi:type I-F CRISPR-associated helicase Cas3f [Hahella aquimaris]|uniref:type I-F CRISPR-associated helicase Cas3f n=1 Tax=Hahella sp. HNIBRBA332 TaxID=3015983 RepID=UPI00273C277F|nr:type I-F CRISPR-associated helicase Cas3f [Hahella sp. HNIBRBA332]WLQ14269.1 type I-F CRISPR-associated helicase Cas3f [Hahella sp. HNIBRBA332]